jgi:hypothetical protein
MGTCHGTRASDRSPPAVAPGPSSRPPPHNRCSRQATWIVTVKAPTRADTEAAFEVFSEATLPACISAVPQALVACLVKTLGAAGQAPAMRAAAARCLSHLISCLARPAAGGCGGCGGAEGSGSGSGRGSGAAGGGGAEPGATAASAAAVAAVSLEGICREPDLMANLYKCFKAGNDGAIGLAPPPPQTGPVQAATPQGGGAAPVSAGEAVAEMAEAAARCVAALVTVGLAGEGSADLKRLQHLATVGMSFPGLWLRFLRHLSGPTLLQLLPHILSSQIDVHNPFTDGPQPADPGLAAAPGSTTAGGAAAAEETGPAAALRALRLALAQHKPWRGLLKAALRPQGPLRGALARRAPALPADVIARRQAYALMALHGLLGAPTGGAQAVGGGAPAAAWPAQREVSKAFLASEMLARRMVADVLAATKPSKQPSTVRSRPGFGAAEPIPPRPPVVAWPLR